MVLYSHNESNLDILLELLIDILLETETKEEPDDKHSISTL